MTTAAPSQQTSRILIAQNYWDQVGGRLFQIINAPAGGTDGVTIQHNTSNLAGSQFLNLGDTLNRPNTNFVVRDNLGPAGTYGVFGGGVGSGTAALNAYAQWTFEGNVLAGANAAVYPANNFYPANFPQGIGFVDPANGDYRLSSSSPYKNQATDGGDPGVDFDALLAKTARALSGIPKTLGDYNGDGTVDAADYTVWRDHMGQTFSLTNENPAAATPGIVDAEDYAFWKSHFGNSLGSGSGTSCAFPRP